MDELIKIQSELKAPKGQYNSFGKYRYRSCEDILEAVKPLLVKNGCTLTIQDEIVPVLNRIYVKATCTLKNKDGKTETTTAYAREAETKTGMDLAQVTSAASSYARKYALNGLFCIDDTKDVDTNEYQQQSKAQAKRQTAQQPSVDNETLQMALVEVRSAQSKESLNEILSRYKMLYNDMTFQTAVREVNAKFKKK